MRVMRVQRNDRAQVSARKVSDKAVWKHESPLSELRDGIVSKRRFQMISRCEGREPAIRWSQMANRRKNSWGCSIGPRALAAQCFVYLLLLFASTAAVAQEGVSALRGAVTDPSGAMVPKATIKLMEPSTGILVRSVASDGQGNFEIPNLKPGTYRQEAALQGFS